MKKDFITALPDSGGGDGTVNITSDSNSGGKRQVSIQISGGGVSKTVNVSQSEGIPNFGVSVSPSTIDQERKSISVSNETRVIADYPNLFINFWNGDGSSPNRLTGIGSIGTSSFFLKAEPLISGLIFKKLSDHEFSFEMNNMEVQPSYIVPIAKLTLGGFSNEIQVLCRYTQTPSPK